MSHANVIVLDLPVELLIVIVSNLAVDDLNGFFGACQCFHRLRTSEMLWHARLRGDFPALLPRIEDVSFKNRYYDLIVLLYRTRTWQGFPVDTIDVQWLSTVMVDNNEPLYSLKLFYPVGPVEITLEPVFHRCIVVPDVMIETIHDRKLFLLFQRETPRHTKEGLVPLIGSAIPDSKQRWNKVKSNNPYPCARTINWNVKAFDPSSLALVIQECHDRGYFQCSNNGEDIPSTIRKSYPHLFKFGTSKSNLFK